MVDTNHAKTDRLRRVINENLRVQLGGAESIEYIDVSNALGSITARQNHVVFGRRGCGKTLLLHSASKNVNGTIKTIYINCEDYKTHSFPNVLIEILLVLLEYLEKQLRGWFGKPAKLRQRIRRIRRELSGSRTAPDHLDQKVKVQNQDHVNAALKLELTPTLSGGIGADASSTIEREYQISDSKINQLNLELPRIKQLIREFFSLTRHVQAIFVQLDDFYHLNRIYQPHIADYIHRLCKDVPIFYKLATLRHASVLYADRGGQPLGAQERHDYQPINVDFTLSDLPKTERQLDQILDEFGKRAGWTKEEIDELFKGEGFRRLVLAAGGVPRDFLSLFLAFDLRPHSIGKDEVRQLSLGTLERRIQELKQDSQSEAQEPLLRGIYAIRKFCIERQSNVFLVSEEILQNNDQVRHLLNRLLDYRIIHSVATALTHKSERGTFQAFMIDIGCYANMRKLEGRFTEHDISEKEEMRNAPVLTTDELVGRLQGAPRDSEAALLAEVQSDTGEGSSTG